MEEEVAETEYCSNCLRDIPAANYVMHVTHCQRNLTLCKVCGEPVPTSQQEEHFEENHAEVKCDCGQHIEKMNLEEHKEKDCPSRLVECQFCELELPFSALTSHVEYCGSRTEKCDICDRYIQKKDLEAHMDTGCQYPVKEEKKQIPSKMPDDFFSEMSVGMLHAMGLMESSERSPNVDNFLPLISGMREFGQILNTGLGTPPFSGASYFGDVDAADAAFGGTDVIARGSRGTRKPGFDQRTSHDFEHVDSDYTQQSDDDDEMLAAAYQADVDTANGTNGTSSGMIDEPFLPDQESDTTQLPCEFCGELLPMDALILHQSGCQLSSLHSFPSSGSADVFFDGSRQYNVPQPMNLADTVQEEFQRNHTELETEDAEDDRDVTFLPCEFCQELFPFDNLIVHQAVCDAGLASLPRPSVLHNGSSPTPLLNNARPAVRNGSQSRPSRPVYESKKIQKSMQSFIPRELDDFGPDSLDLTPNENGHKPEKSNLRFGGEDGATMNNELPRNTSGDRALHGQTVLRNNDGVAMNNELQRNTSDDRDLRGQRVLRNNDGAAMNNELPRNTSDDRDLRGQRVLRNSDGAAMNNELQKKTSDQALRGQTVLRNNDLVNRQPSKDHIPRVKNRTINQPGKRQAELRSGFNGDSYKAPAVKPIEEGLGQKALNTGARRKPVADLTKPIRVPRTSDSNRCIKPGQSSLNEATERGKRDSGTKPTTKTHKSDTRSRPRRTDGVNSDSLSGVRSAASRPIKTKVQDPRPAVNPTSGSATHSSPSNPRRNPPSFHLEGVRLDRGRPQETASESRPSNTQVSAPLRKTTTKKKVV